MPTDDPDVPKELAGRQMEMPGGAEAAVTVRGKHQRSCLPRSAAGHVCCPKASAFSTAATCWPARTMERSRTGGWAMRERPRRRLLSSAGHEIRHLRQRWLPDSGPQPIRQQSLLRGPKGDEAAALVTVGRGRTGRTDLARRRPGFSSPVPNNVRAIDRSGSEQERWAGRPVTTAPCAEGDSEGPQSTLSRVIGRSRTRRPVAL